MATERTVPMARHQRSRRRSLASSEESNFIAARLPGPHLPIALAIVWANKLVQRSRLRKESWQANPTSAASGNWGETCREDRSPTKSDRRLRNPFAAFCKNFFPSRIEISSGAPFFPDIGCCAAGNEGGGNLLGVLVVALAGKAATVPDALETAGESGEAGLARVFRGHQSEVFAGSAGAVCGPHAL